MIISPYKECGEMISALSPSFPYPPLLVDGEALDDELTRRLDELLRAHYAPDAIIGRGVVTTYASKRFPSASIIRIDPNSIDILSPLKQARKFGDSVGILTYPRRGIEENRQMLKDLFDFKEIRVYLFETSEDIEAQVAAAKREGIRSVVGGGTLGQAIASAHGIPSTLVKISRSCILNAVEQAVSIIESRQKEKEQLSNITAIVNCMSEGILAIRGGRVLFSNQALDDIVGLRVEAHHGEAVSEVCLQIEPFVASAARRDVITVHGKNYLVEKLESRISYADDIIVFRNVSELQDKESDVRKTLHPTKCIARYSFKDIIGRDPAIVKAIRSASICASSDAEILITGETGTGKELFAQSIHGHSPRSGGPFVAINCGAIPEQLLESELFGYAEGAFSGARRGGKAGLFELAHRGTMFLDEIDSLPIALQGKLLRVVQEKLLRGVGSESEVVVDIRIISATNRDLEALIQKNEFRSDLFYRISTLSIRLPNLAERCDDIELLADHFVDVYSARYRKEVPPLSRKQVEALGNHRWIGNIRELENVIHRYVILFTNAGDGGTLEECLGDRAVTSASSASGDGEMAVKKDTLEKMERAIIVSLLNEHRWNKQEVARSLGISRCTLWRKLRDSAPGVAE
jgi:transcriptional regulator with PAS, ATPase and Fis domain